MGLKDIINKLFSGPEKPGVEDYPLNEKVIDKDFETYVIERYKDACQSVDEKLPTWNANRAAYFAEMVMRYGGWSAVKNKAGFQMAYSSDSLADKVNDLIAIQTAGGIRIYPLPDIAEDSEVFTLFQTRTEAPTSEVLTFFRKIWEKCIQDLQERQHVNKKDIEVLLDAYLAERGITKQVQEFDWLTGQYDAAIKMVKPENFLDDPTTDDWQDGEYVFEKIYMKPYTAAQLYPDYKEDVYKAVIGKSSKAKFSYSTDADNDHARQKGKVLVAIGYFKDDTVVIKEVPAVEKDPETGEEIRYMKKTEIRKYRTPRKVAILPDVEKMIEDKPSQYSGFPYAVYVPFPTSWDRFGKNMAAPITAVQMTDDQNMQQGIANMKACGNNILEYEQGSVVNEDKIDNSIYQKIKVTHIGSTRFTRAPNILNDVIMMHQMLQTDSNRISGVESVAEGRPAGSLTSGVALDILLGGTNRKVQPRNRMFADFKQEQGKQLVDIMKDVYRSGRVLRVSDEDGLPFKIPFDLAEVTNSVDVRVDSTSEFAVNPTKVLPFLIQLAQIPDIDGLPMVDSKIILDTAEFPGKNEMYERKKEQAQIRQEQIMEAQEGRNAAQTNRPKPGGGAGGMQIAGTE